ncbi:hypothetical protein AWC38_SpisGene10212 [Stylophora pistillata]|uniref:Uncharacterized protein n=1 Tax=Stylophora pistillata TaxID=50429 RepID=A0A2B4S390_STYPI|nr:hypothetical protein AWC38_SpisGene10212 [Stylophora pistillata]
MDAAISEAIQSTVNVLVGRLTDSLTGVIEARLGSLAQRFFEENGATVGKAVKKARRENYTCKRKGNQQPLDHELEVLDKFDAATSVLKNKSYDKVKAALEEGTGIISKRIKAIEITYKSEFGWQNVNEYMSDELASDSDNEKRMCRAERRAERKIKEKRRRQPRPFTRGGSQSTASNVASNSQSPLQAIMHGVDNNTFLERAEGVCFSLGIGTPVSPKMSHSWGDIVSEEEREEILRGERERRRDDEDRRGMRIQRRVRLERRERRNGRSTGDLRDRLSTNREYQEPFINLIMSPIKIY